MTSLPHHDAHAIESGKVGVYQTWVDPGLAGNVTTGVIVGVEGLSTPQMQQQRSAGTFHLFCLHSLSASSVVPALCGCRTGAC
jgi:hypothetical protein